MWEKEQAIAFASHVKLVLRKYFKSFSPAIIISSLVYFQIRGLFDLKIVIRLILCDGCVCVCRVCVQCISISMCLSLPVTVDLINAILLHLENAGDFVDSINKSLEIPLAERCMHFVEMCISLQKWTMAHTHTQTHNRIFNGENSAFVSRHLVPCSHFNAMVGSGSLRKCALLFDSIRKVIES